MRPPPTTSDKVTSRLPTRAVTGASPLFKMVVSRPTQDALEMTSAGSNPTSSGLPRALQVATSTLRLFTTIVLRTPVAPLVSWVPDSAWTPWRVLSRLLRSLIPFQEKPIWSHSSTWVPSVVTPKPTPLLMWCGTAISSRRYVQVSVTWSIMNSRSLLLVTMNSLSMVERLLHGHSLTTSSSSLLNSPVWIPVFYYLSVCNFLDVGQVLVDVKFPLWSLICTLMTDMEVTWICNVVNVLWIFYRKPLRGVKRRTGCVRSWL